MAAISGVCMGGGLELALGAHYRVAKADAQIALPEVKLGLLPGGGGVTRPVRMFGIVQALMGLLVQGQELRPDKALEMGRGVGRKADEEWSDTPGGMAS